MRPRLPIHAGAFQKEAQRIQQQYTSQEDVCNQEGPTISEANTQTDEEEVHDAYNQMGEPVKKPPPPPAAGRVLEECEDPDLFPQGSLLRVAEARQPKQTSFIYKSGKAPRNPPTLLYRYVPLLGTCRVSGP